MMQIRSFVAPSGIEGVGVFAAEDIRAGQIIWRFDTCFDRLIDTIHLNTLPAHIQEFMSRYAYPHHNDPQTLVLEADDGRFMNHSDDANTDFGEIFVGYANRVIQKGEEIFRNYTEFARSPVHMSSRTSKPENEDQLSL